jgi:hypothetical protein
MHGYLVTRYEVDMRRKAGLHYGAWQVHYVVASQYNFHPTNLPRATTYQLRVRAHSVAGSSWYLWKTMRTLG